MTRWNPNTPRSLWMALALLTGGAAGPALAQNHDLVLEPAPDITAPASSTDWHSPDIKMGADFGDGSVADVVRRGVTNPLFARFYINGVLDHTVPSGSVEIRFHYRQAAIGETPPALGAPGAGWNLIGALPVTYSATDPPFILTTTWPTDYPSVVTRQVDWAAPATGSYFHIRAEAVYPAGTSDDNPADNVAISLYESILGVRDVDLAIVHDLSGSMLYYQYAGDSYIDQAKARAQAFVASMNEDDRLAVVGFGDCLPGSVADVWGTPVPPLKQATWANKNAANLAIGGMTIPNTGCTTPLGLGAQRAIQILTSVPLDPARKRAILLLSDGYENSGTPRACSGADPAAPCLGGALLAQLQAAHIRVFSIALGASAWTSCLECLATQTGGEWYAPPGPGISLAQVYLDMQQAYSADDLYRADLGVTGGGDDSYETRFEGLDDVLYFILQSDRLSAEIDLELRPPGGTWQTPGALGGAQIQRGRGYLVVRVQRPARGAWGYRVVGQERQAYLVAVRSDQVGVRLTLDVKSARRVGTPILIRARLTDRGKPVATASLTASIQVPVDSPDTTLRRLAREHMLQHQTPPIDPAQLQKNPDVAPRVALVHTLTNGQQELLVKTRTVVVPLRRQADGSYVGSLTDQTGVAGVYTVTAAYRDKTADRTQSKSVRLLPDEIDYGRSFAELLKLRMAGESGLRWLVRVYPTDRFGNAITDRSPLEGWRVSVRGATAEQKPALAFDGAFEDLLRPAPQQEPVLEEVTIRGKVLRIERAPEAPAKSR